MILLTKPHLTPIQRLPLANHPKRVALKDSQLEISIDEAIVNEGPLNSGEIIIALRDFKQVR